VRLHNERYPQGYASHRTRTSVAACAGTASRGGRAPSSSAARAAAEGGTYVECSTRGVARPPGHTRGWGRAEPASGFARIQRARRPSPCRRRWAANMRVATDRDRVICACFRVAAGDSSDSGARRVWAQKRPERRGPVPALPVLGRWLPGCIVGRRQDSVSRSRSCRAAHRRRSACGQRKPLPEDSATDRTRSSEEPRRHGRADGTPGASPRRRTSAEPVRRPSQTIAPRLVQSREGNR
jgi:hypothetical protein